MNSAAWENQYRTTTVCVDGYENGVLFGRIYNSHVSDGFSFYGVMDFLKKMEELLNEMKFPQPFSENRVFRPLPELIRKEPPSMAPKNGEVATFSLRILFRQNCSWQGSACRRTAGRKLPQRFGTAPPDGQRLVRSREVPAEIK